MTDVQHLDYILIRKKKYKFSFGFKELSSVENNYWLEKIDKNYHACGCNTGKIFTAISLLILVIYYFFYYTGKYPDIKFYLITLGFVIIISLLGKIIGKIRAYNELKDDVKNLKTLILERK
jgi:hypothetical protein